MSLVFGNFFGDFLFWLIVLVLLIKYFGRKVAGSNSEVAVALKTAATKKAIGLIGKFLK